MRRGSLKYRDEIASAAPPSPQGAGEQSADASAAVGGYSSFPLRHATALIASTDGSKTQGKKEA